MEATSLSLAKCIVGSVLSKAKNIIGSEISLLLGVRKELSFIKDEMEMMNAFLRAAAARGQERNEVVRTWVKQVQDLAYNVEDCLDRLAVHFEKDSWLQLRSTLGRRRKIAAEIQAIKSKVEEVSQRNLRYRLITDAIAGDGADSSDEHIDHATVAVQEADLIGQERPRADLIQLVSSGTDEQFRVVAVWGMGGLGKTTLVKDVHSSIEDFKCRIWATLLHPFSLPELLRDMAKQMYVDTSKKDQEAVDTIKRINKMSRDELVHVVKTYLFNKKYILVLDDVSAELEWDLIGPNLPRNRKGSCVVVTTRVEEVASHCGGHVMKLDMLPDDDAYKLFCNKVYKSANCEVPQENRTTVQSILKKCDGLPLAIITVGGFLATKQSTQWQNLLLHLDKEVAGNRSLEKAGAVLASSYESLQHHLKTCFLYMSIFPRNKEIKKTLLVRRWIAEGFVQGRRGATEEEVGESYFRELIGRSMIQPSRMAALINGSFNSCQVHDMMLSISVSKSTEENLVCLLDEHSSPAMEGTVRHLIITDGWDRALNGRAMGRMNMAHNRSLVVYGEWRSSFLSPKMLLLRVLDLEGTKGLEDHNLENIGHFRHLRYLGLRGTDITRLPKSLSKLVNLQTLDVRSTWVTQLTNGITKLLNLRYLRAARPYRIKMKWKVTSFRSGGLCYGDKVPSAVRATSTVPVSEEMPTKTRYSFSRHKIDPFGVKIPSRIGTLSALHTLGVIDVGRRKGIAKEIRSMTQLRKLGLTGLTAENKEEIFEAVAQLQHLQSLELLARVEPNSETVTIPRGSQLSEVEVADPQSASLDSQMSEMSSAATLVSLKLSCELSHLPSWVTSLSNLAKLHLRGTSLLTEHLVEVGILPNLTTLLLLKDSLKKGHLSFPSGSFASLTRLAIVEVVLESLTFGRGSARQLEHLMIVFPKTERYQVGGVGFLESIKSFEESDSLHKLGHTVAEPGSEVSGAAASAIALLLASHDEGCSTSPPSPEELPYTDDVPPAWMGRRYPGTTGAAASGLPAVSRVRTPTPYRARLERELATGDIRARSTHGGTAPRPRPRAGEQLASSSLRVGNVPPAAGDEPVLRPRPALRSKEAPSRFRD